MESLYYRLISQKLKNHADFESFARRVLGLGSTKSGGQGAELPLRSQEAMVLGLKGVQNAGLGILLARLYERNLPAGLIILPTDKEAEHLVEDLRVLGVSAEVWPWSGTTPFSALPQNSPVFGKRMAILSRLAQGDRFFVVSSLRAASAYLPTPQAILAGLLRLRKGQTIDPQNLAQKLSALGYLRVSKVSLPGEFALRGEVLDLSIPGEEDAMRVVFEFDRIEELRRFDMGSQASIGRCDEISVHSFREVVWDDANRTRALERAVSLPEFADQREALEDLLLSGARNFEGEELWYPLTYAEQTLLPQHFTDKGVVFFAEIERLRHAEDSMFREFDGVYRKLRHERPIPRPQRLVAALANLIDSCHRRVVLPSLADTKVETDEIYKVLVDGPRSFFGNISFLKEELEAYGKTGHEVFVLADSEVQKQRLELLLENSRVSVEVGGVRNGFSMPELKVVVIHEHEIFGRRKRVPKSVHRAKSEAIDSFVDLEPGDHVVHINHGIGKFLGIQRISAAGTERDYIKLEYADAESVFVPIEQVNLVQKYIGSQGADPRLDKLGGKSWESRKARVKKKVEELAEHLISLYSRRKRATGFSFPEDTEWQIQFESAFPYEETEDQVRCIDEVKADMEKPLPMDRLVCGDVGFGKTEIAMRAAFKAVTAGKQVAFLAPTTILAEQHYETLQERLRGFPIKTQMLSRFVQKSDQKTILESAQRGEVDILVGTHRIVQKDVRFKDLGLMIIDEEQRFGVKDKERLKELKTSVDSLTLSATPIPRTLHMSLLKIRDMSVLKTAPYNRRPIETHVEAFNEEIVARAVRREIARGGQIFYLHNRIESLENVQLMLEKIVPEVLVETAHGQLGPKELEDIMHRFVHGGFHVLIATTIIENGINIPNVNTIIIDRADMYGVSQLYQLRGRVGRSDRLAYAYLLYPGERALSEVAMKRLQIISDNTELGSGFKIALKDLEVRGAGNLLGAEQSGEIYAVGFDLYLKLLDEAVRKLAVEEASGELSEFAQELVPETYLELDYSGFIPENYISDPMEKMEVYKKISGVGTDGELEAVFAEIEDRFGPVPEEVHSLLSLAELRILCRKLRISSLKERRGSVEIEFGKLALINIDRLVAMVRSSGGAVLPVPNHPNKIRMKSDGIGLKEKSEFIRGRLSQLLK